MLRLTGIPLFLAAALLGWCILPSFALADNPFAASDTTEVNGAVGDTLDVIETLELALPPADTSRVTSEDTPAAPGTGGAGGRRAGDGAPEGAVRFSAQDSLIIEFGTPEGDVATLFREGSVTHGPATLAAYRIDMLLQREELRARGEEGQTEGLPSFQRGQEGFTGRELAYNMRTDRGRVVEARTEMDDGFIQGDVIKVMDDGTRYAQGGRYTTCNIPLGETPSYSLRADRMKEQDEWVYTGPIQLYIFDIPTPLILPLGFLPNIEGRRSGPLPPQYGEDRRGFYLRGWGYYWAMNDYMDLEARFGLWSQGSWEVSPRYRYNLRNRYSGNVGITFIQEQSGDIVDPNHSRQRSTSLRWTHNQTMSPFSRFNASVNLSNTNYLRTNTENYQDQVRQTINSSISYNRNFRTGQSLNFALNHQQTLRTGNVSMTLPSMSFTQNTFQPFEHDNRPPGQDARWYEQISMSYRGSLNNRVRYNPRDPETLRALGDTTAAEAGFWDVLTSPDMFRRVTGQEGRIFQTEADHNIPIRTSFQFDQLPFFGTPMQLNISPSLTYNESWFLETDRRDPTDTGFETRDEAGFFALRQFNFSVSANTRFFGTFPFDIGDFSGLRHTVNPSISYNYRPDYWNDFWGYTRTYTTDDGEEVRYPIRREVPTRGSQQSIGLNVRNEFQTRRVQIDEEGEQQFRSLNLLNVDVSTNYNFAADSLNMQSINVSARSNIVNDVSLRFRASFSPYQVEGTGIVNRWVAQDSPWSPLRLERMTLGASTSFQSSEGRGQQAQAPATRDPQMQDPAMGDAGMPDPFQQGYGTGTPYADFSIPWSINLDFSGTYSPARGTIPAMKRATINSRFDFNLTPNWAIGGNTGVDLVNMELSRTQLNVSRDLDCWQMTFHWTPFGSFQQFGFSLFVKSGKLSDLLRLDVPSSDVRGRFGQAARQF